MNKSIALIGLLALIAIGAIGMVFVSRARLAEQEALMQDQMILLMEEQQRLQESGSQMLEDKRANEELAQQALQAKIMAEALGEKERREREELVSSLNERLIREAEDRKQAEAAQAELAGKIAALEAAQAESKAALDALELERQGNVAGSATTASLRDQVEAQEQQLAALAEENENLKEQQVMLESKQVATEEAIVKVGGRIRIPYPEIRSANARRKEAIYFKERVAGHPIP